MRYMLITLVNDTNDWTARMIKSPSLDTFEEAFDRLEHQLLEDIAYVEDEFGEDCGTFDAIGDQGGLYGYRFDSDCSCPSWKTVICDERPHGMCI